MDSDYEMELGREVAERIEGLKILLREWFDNYSSVELTDQRDEYYYCHSCKQIGISLKGIRHTEDCLLVRTEKALYPMMVVKKKGQNDEPEDTTW